MNASVTDCRGTRWTLPPLTAWRLEFTTGVPCDSFWLRCPWDSQNTANPADWVRFHAAHQGETVFTGLVDECEATHDHNGSVLEVSGRGMAALLLDNEALGQDYGVATQADILRDHVEPYGIQTAPGPSLPAVPHFSVATGSSEWAVLYHFARYYGGISPRFDRSGQLLLRGWDQTTTRLLGDAAPVTRSLRRNKRYGTASQVLVRDRYSGEIHTVENPDFLAAGGRARRVVTLPGRGDHQTMRYTGQFQLERSAAELERLEITVAEPFCAWPGDLVQIQKNGFPWNGTYRAARVTVQMNANGYQSELDLAPPDLVL